MTTLEEWDQKIKSHLEFISAGAEMAARHAKMLPARGDWQSRTQDDLKTAREALETALAKIIVAEAFYETAPVEKSYAA